MTIEVLDTQRFDMMERVADLRMQGNSETQIAKELGLKRKVVLELFAEYKDLLYQDGLARDMARDHLNQMVKHYDYLIKRFYMLVDEIDLLDFNHQVAGQKNNTLKSIAELEAKRLDALQKAGLMDSAELGDELAEMEEMKDILLEILQKDLCYNCKIKVAEKLQKVSGKVETIDAQVIDNA